MTKVQLSLTEQEAMILNSQAAMLGYNLTRYIKLVISQAAMKIAEANIPTYPMSESLEKVGLNAKQDHKKGLTHKLDNIADIATW